MGSRLRAIVVAVLGSLLATGSPAAQTTQVIGPTTAAGWVDVPFSASDFTAGGSMTWTVESGDVVTHRYRMLDPHTMLFAVVVGSTDIGGTPSNELRLNVPNNKRARSTTGSTLLVTNNSIEASGRYIVAAGGTFLSIFQQVPVTAWTAGTGVCGILLTVVLDVEERP